MSTQNEYLLEKGYGLVTDRQFAGGIINGFFAIVDTNEGVRRTFVVSDNGRLYNKPTGADDKSHLLSAGFINGTKLLQRFYQLHMRPRILQ